MYRERQFIEDYETTGNSHIPNDEVRDWLRTLANGPFTEDEIDVIVASKNERYLHERINDKLREVDAIKMSAQGRHLTEDERTTLTENFKEQLLSGRRINNEPHED